MKMRRVQFLAILTFLTSGLGFIPPDGPTGVQAFSSDTASGATSDATGRHQAGWTSLDPDSAAAPIDSTLHGPDFDLDCGRCHT
ncbi:MAG: hypothetical protein ABIF77_14550, partial [bacterium]